MCHHHKLLDFIYKEDCEDDKLKKKVYVISRRNQEWMKFGECLLPVNSESFFFLSRTGKHKDCNIQNHNSLTLREELRLRVFGDMALRRIFGPNRK
jgi:hypothetical protein